MPDFEKGKAPWYESAADITEITVTNGIEYIGSPAFDGIDGTDYIILPSSVSAVGEDFAEDPIKIFVFDNNINFATEPKNW